MKAELAKQLLKNIIEPIVDNDEDKAEMIFNELQFLAEYKYDRYEMYAPGRHFFEYLYIWLKQFDESDRAVALDLVRKHLIFFTREEFELLSRVLYWETVRQIQFDLAAKDENIPRYRVNKIAGSDALSRIERSSLYIGMSDGARIDYFRRQHKTIGNEQVLTSYHVDHRKCNDMIKELEDSCGSDSRFRLVFLIDDFCASGTTLIREKNGQIKGTLYQLESKTFPQKTKKDEKELLIEPTLFDTLLSDNSKIYLCPMLATQKAIEHIKSHCYLLSSQLKKLIIRPTSILNESLNINELDSPIGQLCTEYYQERMGDEHTGNVTLGYSSCGLTVVLHHNTPNNSLYLLWNRLASEQDSSNPPFEPLFKRIERHKSKNR